MRMIKDNTGNSQILIHFSHFQQLSFNNGSKAAPRARISSIICQDC